MMADRLYEWVAEGDEEKYERLAFGMRGDGEALGFWDTNRMRLLEGEVRDSGTAVSVKADTGFRWEFRIVTLDRFFQRWYPEMGPKPPYFPDDEEMHAWYARLSGESGAVGGESP